MAIETTLQMYAAISKIRIFSGFCEVFEVKNSFIRSNVISKHLIICLKLTINKGKFPK